MINDKIEEYYFVDVYLDKDNVYYPQNVKARVWMRDTFPTSYLIGDGSPFCIFDEGFIIKKSELEKIKEYGKDFSILADVYNLDNSSWKTIDDFIMDFEDGDVETSQFIFVDSLDKRTQESFSFPFAFLEPLTKSIVPLKCFLLLSFSVLKLYS